MSLLLLILLLVIGGNVVAVIVVASIADVVDFVELVVFVNECVLSCLFDSLYINLNVHRQKHPPQQQKQQQKQTNYHCITDVSCPAPQRFGTSHASKRNVVLYELFRQRGTQRSEQQHSDEIVFRRACAHVGIYPPPMPSEVYKLCGDDMHGTTTSKLGLLEKHDDLSTQHIHQSVEQ